MNCSLGPPELDCDWDDSGIDGVFRFLNRVWKMVYANKASDKAPSRMKEYIVNKMIADVTKACGISGNEYYRFHLHGIHKIN